MPSTSHALDEARDLIKKRLNELNDECKRLEKAVIELGGKVGGRVGRPPGSPARNGSQKRRRRRGGRARQAVSLIEKNPGISASEIAKAIKIAPSYVYQLLGVLEKEGKIEKKGRQLFPVG